MTLRRPLLAVSALCIALVAVSGGTALAASPTPGVTAGPAASPGVPQLGLGVGQSQLILGPGNLSGSFVVGNGGQVEASVTVSAFDFVIDSEGHKTPAKDPNPLGAASWVTISPTTFTLPAEASQKVTVTMTIPANASPGDHYAGITVLGKVSDAAWARLQGQLGSGVNVRSQISFPLTLISRVPGTVVNALSAELSVPPFITTTANDYTFAPRIINDGNVAAVWAPASGKVPSVAAVVPALRLASAIGYLAGDALLYDGSQNAQGVVNLVPITVLPGATLTQQLVLRDVPLLGSYDYTYTLPGSEADGRATVTATGHFVIVNLVKVLLYVVLPFVLLLILLVVWLFRRRRSRARKRRDAEAREREREEIKRDALAQARQEAYEQLRREAMDHQDRT